MILPVVVAVLVQQSTPTGGAIAKLVPPVPTPSSFISDRSDVIPADKQAALDARIAGIQGAGLGDIAVAILPSIGDYSPNQVAVEIYRTWKVGSQAAIGNARRNLGVLLLIVPKELSPNKKGECWINTGTGAEGIITDGTAGSICRDVIIPPLKNRDYAGAVDAGIGAIELRLRGDRDLAAQPAMSTDSPRDGGFPVVPVAIGGGVLGLIGLIGAVRRHRRYRPRACKRCGHTMRRLDERADNAHLEHGQVVEEQVKSIDYDVWLCDCGETQALPYRAWFTSYSACRECKRRTAKARRRTIVAATTSASGMAEDRYSCKSCGATWKVDVVLPRIQQSSSSGSSGGGGGGGGSFGGSGSTSGGGGGGSY